MTIEIRILKSEDRPLLDDVAADVFDHAVHPDRAAEFLRDPRHHLAIASDDGQIVGFASGVHYVHPDKDPELWVNEVGVAPSHQGLGLGKAIMRCLLAHARHLGCREAWVLTDRSNAPAIRLYGSAGGEEAADDLVMFTFPLEREESAPETG